MQADNPKYVNIKAFTVAKITFIVLIVILAMQFISSIIPILFILLASIFFAVALNPIVNKIKKFLYLKHRTTATGLAFVIIISVISSFLMLTIPLIYSHFKDLADNLPSKIETFIEDDNWLSNTLVEYELDGDLENIANTVREPFQDTENIFGLLINAGTSIFQVIGSLVLILVFTFLIISNGPVLIQRLEKSLPKAVVDYWQPVCLNMKKVIIGYINGQVLISLIGGFFAFVMMSILGVDNALAMAAIVAFFTLIPLIGALLGSVLVVMLVVITLNINDATILAVYFIVYQLIENVTIQPWMQSKQTNLSTFQVILVALIGGTLAGVMGALLFIPIAACLKILIMYYIETHSQQISDKYKITLGRSKKVSSKQP